jgi:hypothetical protein
MAEIINSIYYVFSILYGPEDTTALYMSLIQASDLPQQYFVFDLYLPAVSSLCSVWMSRHFAKATSIIRSNGENDESFEVRWISPCQVFRLWLTPIVFLGLLFAFEVQIPELLWIMFVFRVVCVGYMVYALISLNNIDTSNVWIMQTRLYIIISIAWQSIYSIDDGVPESVFQESLVRNLLYGYLPISATFARIFMNGTVFLFSNRRVISQMLHAILHCRRIVQDESEQDDEDLYDDNVANPSPALPRRTPKGDERDRIIIE